MHINNQLSNVNINFEELFMNNIMNSIVLENIVKSTPNDQELGAYIRKFFLESEPVEKLSQYFTLAPMKEYELLAPKKQFILTNNGFRMFFGIDPYIKSNSPDAETSVFGVKQEKTTKQPVTECYDCKQTVEFPIYDWIIERMDYSQLWKEIMKRAKELKGSDLSAYDIWKLGNLSGSYEIIIEPFNRFAETLKKQRLERMRNFLRSMKKP